MAADDEGKPPVFSTWRGAYLFVLACLLVTIAGLTLLSRHFR